MSRRVQAMRSSSGLLMLFVLALLVVGCSKKQPPPPPAAPPPPVHFVNVAQEAGLEVFRHGGSADTSILEQPIPRDALTGGFVRAKIASFLGSGVGFADYDGDGHPDLYLVNCGPDEATSRNTLFRNNGDGTFTDVTDEAGVGHRGQGFAVTWGDYDNDGLIDLYVANNGPNVLYRNNGDGTFSDVTEEANAQDDRFTIATTFADYDHDGDLDLYLVNYIDLARLPKKAQLRFPEDFPGADNVLLQNDGSGRFNPKTDETKLGDGGRRGRAAVFADLTINNAVDLFLANDREPCQVLISSWDGTKWDGTFRDDAPQRQAALETSAQGLALGDFDNDGYPDCYVTTGAGQPDVLLKNEVTTFRLYQATPGLFDLTVERFSTGSVFFDYDNDGAKDILSVGEDTAGSGAGTVLLFANNNDGNVVFQRPPTFRDVTGEARLVRLGSPRCRGLSVADYDGDGDVDVCVQVNGGSPLLLRNEGGNRNNWLEVRLVGVHGRDNRSAIGAKVQVNAGKASRDGDQAEGRPIRNNTGELFGANGYQSSNINVLYFGLGQNTTANLYIKWPQGYVQRPTNVPANQVYTVTETTAAKPSSCPLVFAWDGERYRFLSDTLGSVHLGAIMAVGSTYMTASLLDTDEYLKIPGEQLKSKDGYWSIIFSDRLQETAYLDRAKLLVADHPADVVLYLNERLSSRPPYPEFRLFASRSERLLVSAVREDGTDILPALSKIDRVYAPHGKLLSYGGIVEPHSYILDLGDLSGYEHPVLVLYGWSDFAMMSSRDAAGQAGIRVLPVTLSVKNASDQWTVAIEDIGEPGAWPKPQAVDLAGLFTSSDYRVKITTNIPLCYDRATVIDAEPRLAVRLTELEPDRARLVQAGFATAFRPDGRKPDLFDHEEVMPYRPWSMFCFGKHTRYGDVRPLLLEIDDMYAIMAPGDEVVIDFGAAKAPELPEGWVRDFILYTDGFTKDIDFRSAFGGSVEPLPFHGMTAYPPPPGQVYPMDEEHRRYLQTYNTRDITPSTAAVADAYTFGFQSEKGLREQAE